ncbi:hypothetical protein D6774_02300 [Candidatus Woesearchaeota archaeon]|nr:MAG: hypothetical protein D6774_02300 [Candidatus Woesearchaeota archaeon]
MYQRYIKKNGQELGPYWYHSFKTRDGKVKSVYLGSDEESAKLKLEQLRIERAELRREEDLKIARLEELKMKLRRPTDEKTQEELLAEMEEIKALLNLPN